MRVLIVTMSLPYPPASGGAIRVHGIVEGLHKAGHDVTLLCFHDNPVDFPNYIRVETIRYEPRSIFKRLRTLLLSNRADIETRFFTSAFADRLTQILEKSAFDLIQFEGIEMACYLALVKAKATQAKLVFDTFNAEFELQRKIYEIDRTNPKRMLAAVYSFLQVRRIKFYEQRLMHLADATIAVSPEDIELLRPLHPDGKLYFIPNGIWVDRYQGDDEIPIEPPSPHTLVFTGKMDYRPNVDAVLWFIEAIFPAIKQAIPDAHLMIVGQQPHPRLNMLNPRPDVTITGWVESVLPYLQEASAYVAPLRMGSGTRLKLLEAMAAGCSIVATETASAGMIPEVKSGMIIQDDPAQFAEAVINLLKNPGKRHEVQEQNRALVREYYDWSALIPRLLRSYEALGLLRG